MNPYEPPTEPSEKTARPIHRLASRAALLFLLAVLGWGVVRIIFVVFDSQIGFFGVELR